MTTYNKHHPFLGAVSCRYPLTKPGSQKNTQHLELSLSHSEIHYKVGDSLAIFPTNDPLTVKQTLHALHASGDEEIIDARSQQTFCLRDYLSKRANICNGSRKLLTLLHARERHAHPKRDLEHLLKPENSKLLAEWLEQRELWDTLLAYPQALLTPQEVCDTLSPILPRFYSISSSQLAVGAQADCTVALTEYISNGHLRKGVATNFLVNLAPLHEKVVPLYLHPSKDFTLPKDDQAPIIMIGPGTGVAPYRGFMQERMAKGATGKNWLFFGEWTRRHEYFYGEYWEELAKAGKLRLDLAFSRDQPEKIYVQQRMLEKAKELWEWLQAGAYVYVCGDAAYMAKGVELTLQQIIGEQGALSEESSRAYLKQLRHDKRYLRDVY